MIPATVLLRPLRRQPASVRPGLRYLSVCAGIEAVSVAVRGMGWTPSAFCEIEKFPCAVLAHHWPEVPNLGDMTRWHEWPEEVFTADLLVGGTPCQAFSVAGLRNSLDDERGNLTLTYARILDHIDRVRAARGLPPAVCLWENVPGVLNTKDNAFGCFLAGLAGEDVPLEPPGGRWTDAGYVRGPQRAVAWRCLDAQYFGLAQRRKRVFVVAGAGAIRPEQVLLEWEGVRRDSPPSRETGQGAAGTPACRPAISSGQGWWSESDVGATIRVQDSVTKADTLIPQTCGLRGQTRKSRGDKGGGHEESVGHTPWQVRRLTVTECEFLMGVPRNFTLIPWRGKPASDCPDGPRYKALGNSMAVPVIRWICERIERFRA